MYLPHELFATLYALDAARFDRLFGAACRREGFWRRSVDSSPEWLTAHPVLPLLDAGEVEPQFTIPVRVFGDGTSKQNLVRTMHLAAELKTAESAEGSKLPVYV